MYKDKYINWIRLDGIHKSGEINYPRGTHFTIDINGMVILEHGIKPICKEYSQTSYKYLGLNNDNRGLERAELIYEIRNKLARVRNRSERFVKLACDDIACLYRKIETEKDRCGFYWDVKSLHRASIGHLEHILAIAITMY